MEQQRGIEAAREAVAGRPAWLPAIGTKIHRIVVAAAAAFAISGCEAEEPREHKPDVISVNETADTGVRNLGSYMASDGMHIKIFAPAGGDREVDVYIYPGDLMNLSDMKAADNYTYLGKRVIRIDGKHGEIVIPEGSLPASGYVKVVPVKKDCRYTGMEEEICYPQEIDEKVQPPMFEPDDFSEIAQQAR